MCARAFYTMPLVVLSVTVDSESDLKINQRDAIAASLISVTVHSDTKQGMKNVSARASVSKKKKKKERNKRQTSIYEKLAACEITTMLLLSAEDFYFF